MELRVELGSLRSCGVAGGLARFTAAVAAANSKAPSAEPMSLELLDAERFKRKFNSQEIQRQADRRAAAAAAAAGAAGAAGGSLPAVMPQQQQGQRQGGQQQNEQQQNEQQQNEQQRQRQLQQPGECQCRGVAGAWFGSALALPQLGAKTPAKNSCCLGIQPVLLQARC